jgi:hypothetical protein
MVNLVQNLIILIFIKILLVLFIVVTLCKMVRNLIYINAARGAIGVNNRLERFIQGDDPIDR